MKVYIFLFIYTFSCIGVMVDFHYCSGDLVSVTFYPTDEDNCCGEDEEKNDDCCHDKYLLVDTDETEGLQTFAIDQNDFVKKQLHNYKIGSIFEFKHYVFSKNLVPLNHAPPNRESSSLFLKNRVMLI